MPLPYKSRGFIGSGNPEVGGTKYQESYMENLESSFPDWHNDAECSRHDPELFMVSVADSADIKEALSELSRIGYNDVARFNKEKFEKAKKICDTCLVKDKCIEDATPEDMQATMRGGIIPAHSTFLRGRPKGSKDGRPRTAGIDRNGKACKRNHIGRWASETRGGYRCLECDRLRQEAKKDGKTLEPVMAPPGAELCPEGHSEWRMHGVKRPHRVCMPCKREKDKGFRKHGPAILNA